MPARTAAQRTGLIAGAPLSALLLNCCDVLLGTREGIPERLALCGSAVWDQWATSVAALSHWLPVNTHWDGLKGRESTPAGEGETRGKGPKKVNDIGLEQRQRVPSCPLAPHSERSEQPCHPFTGLALVELPLVRRRRTYQGQRRTML